MMNCKHLILKQKAFSIQDHWHMSMWMTLNKPLPVGIYLLSGHKIFSLPEISEFNSEEIEEISSHELLTKKSLYLSTLMTHFWKRRWRKYLVDLWEHHHIEAASKSGLKLKLEILWLFMMKVLKKVFWDFRKLKFNCW